MKWVSVKEKMPELKCRGYLDSSDPFLAFDGERVFITHTYKYKAYPDSNKEDKRISFCHSLPESDDITGEITHWMPLPKPPKEVINRVHEGCGGQLLPVKDNPGFFQCMLCAYFLFLPKPPDKE